MSTNKKIKLSIEKKIFKEPFPSFEKALGEETELNGVYINLVGNLGDKNIVEKIILSHDKGIKVYHLQDNAGKFLEDEYGQLELLGFKEEKIDDTIIEVFNKQNAWKNKYLSGINFFPSNNFEELLLLIAGKADGALFSEKDACYNIIFVVDLKKRKEISEMDSLIGQLVKHLKRKRVKIKVEK